jgi:hypothetical protein
MSSRFIVDVFEPLVLRAGWQLCLCGAFVAAVQSRVFELGVVVVFGLVGPAATDPAKDGASEETRGNAERRVSIAARERMRREISLSGTRRRCDPFSRPVVDVVMKSREMVVGHRLGRFVVVVGVGGVVRVMSRRACVCVCVCVCVNARAQQ